MARLRGAIPLEKQKRKSFKFFSKVRKRNKSPTVDESPNVANIVGVKTVKVFLSINDWWHLPQGCLRIEDFLQLLNILAAVYMVGGNLYTVTFCWDVFCTGTSGKQTYFTPAPWSFLMWTVIHTLMFGSCICQFSYQGSSVLLDQAGWKLPLLHISNAIYIHCRNSRRYKCAFVWIIVTYVLVNKIYRIISKIPSRDIRDQLFCHLLFSLHHGWVLGLMFLTAFEAFGVDAVTTPARGGTKVSVLLSFMLIQLFEWAYASPAIEGDFFACLAVSWFLFAITVEQSATRSAFVHWSAHGFTIFSLCWVTKCMIGLELRDSKKVLKKDEEPASSIT